MEEQEKIPVYELTMDDIDFDAITAMSIVDFPAVEKDFMKFAKKNKVKFEFGKADVDKKIITGVALIPDKKIYRFDMMKGEYEVFFSAETILKLSQKFLKEHKQSSVTVQHEYNANNIYIFESWIIEDGENDKANALGFKDLPSGTWMISMRIENNEIWEQIKNDELRGFSIEAYVSTILTDLEKQVFEEDVKELTDNEIMIKEIKRLLDDFQNQPEDKE